MTQTYDPRQKLPQYKSPKWEQRNAAEVAGRPAVVPLNHRHQPTPEQLAEVRKIGQWYAHPTMPVPLEFTATRKVKRLAHAEAIAACLKGEATVVPPPPVADRAPHLAAVETEVAPPPEVRGPKFVVL